jgi:hypothetical protein
MAKLCVPYIEQIYKIIDWGHGSQLKTSLFVSPVLKSIAKQYSDRTILDAEKPTISSQNTVLE